jgi:hypothetical protein
MSLMRILNKPIVVLGLAGAVIAAVVPAQASLCVWRKPDQDIKEFFPGAESYKTELKSVGDKGKAIEKLIGAKLDPDEHEFKFFRIIKDKKTIGTVMTHLGKGQYGAIEVVVAFKNDGKIIGVEIQRDREKKRKELRSEDFLGQFKGKTAKSALTVGNDIKLVEGARESSEAVAFAVKKLAVAFSELG